MKAEGTAPKARSKRDLALEAVAIPRGAIDQAEKGIFSAIESPIEKRTETSASLLIAKPNSGAGGSPCALPR
jgi:hypothetical protein